MFFRVFIAETMFVCQQLSQHRHHATVAVVNGVFPLADVTRALATWCCKAAVMWFSGRIRLQPNCRLWCLYVVISKTRAASRIRRPRLLFKFTDAPAYAKFCNCKFVFAYELQLGSEKPNYGISMAKIHWHTWRAWSLIYFNEEVGSSRWLGDPLCS